MKKFSKEIKIALTAIVAVALLFYGINFLKGINLFKTSSTYYVVFNDITGLSKNNPVYAGGYPVGTVQDIRYDYDHPGRIIVRIDIDQHMKLPKGCTADLVSSMLGTTTMNLRFKPSDTFLQPGDSLTGAPYLGALEQAGNMIPKIEQMLKDYGVKMQLFVVPTGVNLHKFSSIRNQEFIRLKRQELGIPEKNKIMISVGRVAPEKSLDKLIDTRHLMGDVPVTLLIVGGGPAEEDLHRQAEELRLLENKKVVFTGMIDPEEVHSYYQLGDVFACASTSETQGLTYYEAMACGLP